MWKVCRTVGALWWAPRSLPPISMILGIRSQCCFSLSERRSLSWGSWHICCWSVGWRSRGSGAWHVFTDSHCLFLVRLFPFPRPTSASPRDPAFSSTGEGKGPGQRDRSGPSPLQGCSAGTLNDSLSPPRERRLWAVDRAASRSRVQAAAGVLRQALYFAELWDSYSFKGSAGPECFQQRLRHCARHWGYNSEKQPLT